VLSTVSVLLADMVLPLSEKVKQTLWGQFFVETAQLTMVVQLCTFPLLWYYFGSVSMLTLPANTLLLWLTPFLTYVALLAAVVGCIEMLLPLPLLWEPVHLVFRSIGWVMGSSFLTVAEFLAKWEFSVVMLPQFHWGIGVTWYGVLLLYVVTKWKRSREMYQGLLCM
jgi:hypothetical protein